MNEQQPIAPETGTEEEINLLELVRVLVRNLPLIVKITTTAVILSVLYSLTLKNVYTATATLLPPPKEAGGAAALFASAGGGLAGLAGGLGGASEMYLGILKSRSVTDGVITRLDLRKELKLQKTDDGLKRVQGMVKFQAGTKDGIITITATYKDPVKAALLANTFVEEFQKKSLQLNLTKASTERSFLEKRLVAVKQDLKAAEDDMKNFQEKNKTIKADDQAKAAIEGIAKLKADLVIKEVQLAALRNSMTDESSEVRTLLAGIAKLKSQLGSMSGAGEEGVIPSVGSAPTIGMEYVRRLRELKTQEALYEQLTKQYELAKINEARESSSIQVLDEAVAPLRKSKPSRAMIVIIATVTAFFGSVFFVFIREYLAKLSPEDSAIINDMKGDLKGLRLRDVSLKPGSLISWVKELWKK